MNLKETIENNKRSRVIEDSGVAIVLEKIDEFAPILVEIAKNLKALAEKPNIEIPEVIIPETKFPDVQVVKVEGVELLKGEKGDTVKGEPGENYILTEDDKKEIAEKITIPIVDRVIERTEVIKEKPVITNEVKEVAKYEEAEQIAKKLNTLKEKIEQYVIIGLEDWMKKVEKRVEKKTVLGSRGGGGDVIAFYDLSSQTNGILKSFTVPKGRKVVVFGSDFPTVLMEGNGFTMDSSRTTLTLTVDNAPSTSSQLLYQYTK